MCPALATRAAYATPGRDGTSPLHDTKSTAARPRYHNTARRNIRAAQTSEVARARNTTPLANACNLGNGFSSPHTCSFPGTGTRVVKHKPLPEQHLAASEASSRTDILGRCSLSGIPRKTASIERNTASLSSRHQLHSVIRWHEQSVIRDTRSMNTATSQPVTLQRIGWSSSRTPIGVNEQG